MADFSSPVVQTTKNSKSALKLGIVVVLTVVLAGVAVFTAVRLYQLRSQAVAPTAPTSKPAAQVSTLTPPSSTPVATPSPSLSPSPSATASSTPKTSLSPSPKASAPPIPESGMSTPTIIGVGVGILAIVLSIALAF